ncbi:unnamed protein product, partial [Nippostrongylus brasiliensis]|uniref:VWFA domain-containing protein n=1 Tax=Nippostrongylus brasiliensis TaxID=27835 RepID=A0A0N4Y5X6_NIPBR
SASSQFSTPKKGLVRRAHGVRGRRAKEERNIFTPGQKCGEGKVDLTLVLDTSGSVFRVFEDQRQIALEILDEIPVEAYTDAVQVSVTRFAAYADVILPFLKGRSVSEINEAIKEVKFTGQNTRIASAVEIAIDEMERARRPDARQIFVLISDGHGQEYWNVVQATGKRLQETKAELFAVSASHDYNQAELLIYVGDESRVFVGPKYTGFLSILSSYLKDCIFRGRKPPATVPVGNSLSDLAKSDAAVEEFASSTAEGPLADEASTTEESPVDEFSDELSSTVRSVTVESSSAEGSAVEEASSTVELLARSSSTSLPSTTTEEAPLAEEIAPTTSEEVLDEGNGIASTVEPSDGAEGSEEEFEDEISELDTSGQPNRAARLKDIAKASSCPVDIILMVDRSQSVVDDFRKEVELAIRSVELFSPSQYSSGRIRVGAVSFAKEAQVELSLGKSARDDVVKRLEEMVHTGGSTSAVTGARLALQSLVSSRRPNARLITLLFTDGQSQDYWRELIDTSMRIRDIPNSVLLAFTASQQFSASELQLWAGETSKVFVASEEKGFLHAIGKEVNRCRKEELVDKAEELVDVEKKPFDRQPITQTSPEVVVSTTPEGIDDDRTTIEVDEVFEFSTRGETAPFESSSVGSTIPVVDFESETTASGLEAETSTLEGSGVEDVEEGSGQRDLPIVNDNRALGILTAKEIAVISDEKQPEVLNSSTSCLTDLILVIDRSTSVEADFQQQVQLAVDLVKRLPAVDFEDRIRVGVVVFNARAEVAFRMNEARSRSAVLDSLLGLRHAGGSTSVASGVNLALDQIDADRRKSARLMVVLLSDGNSQDHWNQVIRSSNRLRTTGAAVYAVTMSKKELELYAGDKLRVYIDARVRQFLDEVEQAVTHCGTPAKTSSSSVILQSPKSCSSFVDLVILLDTSTPVEEFFREKQLAVDLIRALPPSAFERRLAVSVIPFSNTSTILTPLAVLPKDEVVFELERLSNAT